MCHRCSTKCGLFDDKFEPSPDADSGFVYIEISNTYRLDVAPVSIIRHRTLGPNYEIFSRFMGLN